MLFKRIFVAFFSCILLVLSAYFLFHSSPVCGQADSVKPAIPFCDQKNISLPIENTNPLSLLSSNGLILDCHHVPWNLEAGNNKLFFNDRKKICDRYDEIRNHFLTIRKQIQGQKGEQTLLSVEQMLPIALCKVAFPPWQGTTWDFYGASSVPGEGEIACGYFVAATLYAVGFNIKVSLKQKNKRHYTLAGLPSEQIIRKLVDEKSIRRFSNRPFSEVEQAVKEMGPGVFLIGLDQHVAYLVYDGKNPVLAWHAKPGFSVVLEKPQDAPFISQSHYRVLGKLDRKSAKIWLTGAEI